MSRYPRISFRKRERKYKRGGSYVRADPPVGLPCVRCGRKTTGQVEVAYHWSEPDDDRKWFRACADCIDEPDLLTICLTIERTESRSTE